MGTLSLNKLGGLALVVGPLLAVACFMIRPGGGIVGGMVDPADAAASIGTLMANAGLAGISFPLVALGLLLFYFGVAVFVENMKGGNGESLGRLGALFVLFAVIGWVTSSALGVAVAGGNAGAAAGAVYAVSLSVNLAASILGPLGFLVISLGVSTRDDSNKIFALVVAAASAVLLVIAVMSSRDLSLLQTTSWITGIGYVVTSIWAVTLGLGLMKKA